MAPLPSITLDLDDFCRRVGTASGTPSSAILDKEGRQRAIAECFPRKLAYKAVVALRSIEADLAVRLICADRPLGFSAEVAKEIRLALQKYRGGSAEVINWDRAIALALVEGVSPEVASQLARMNERWASIAKGVSMLRARGVAVSLPDQGGVVLSEASKQQLWGEIRRFAKQYAPWLAWCMAANLAKNYSALSGRFRVGRSGKTVNINPEPDVPLVYMYHLSLSYFDQRPCEPPSDHEFQRFIDLVMGALALEDLVLPFWELQFAWVGDLPSITMKSALYDAAYIPAQAKSAHAKAYLQHFFSDPALLALKDLKTGRTGVQVGAVAMALLDLAERSNPGEFVRIDSAIAESLTGMHGVRAVAFLRAVFGHDKDVNKDVRMPPRDTDINAAFRPLLLQGTYLVMQPAPMASRAIVNAVLQWLREQRPNKFDDEVLGPKIESLIRSSLAARSIDVIHGAYQLGKENGQCDVVIETEKAVIFIELKSKMLRREGRAGDGIKLLADLGQAVIRPLSQAMRHHAFLLKHKKMALECEDGVRVIELGDREVFKVSLSRGELNSLHSRPYVQKLLVTGCLATFETEDQARTDELSDLRKFFTRLRNAAKDADEYDMEDPLMFDTCWSLSVFQLLMLLEKVTDAEGLYTELVRTRRIMTPNRDFYTEYEYFLSLQSAG